jgi:hypothetical protein
MRTLVTGFLAAAVLAWCMPALADVLVIVNATNPTKSFSQKEVVDLYMGRNRTFPGGDYAMVFDLPRDNAVRAEFYLQITGMSAAQINSYWSRLMFTGQTLPPQPLPNEAAVIDMVKRNPSAVGYVTNEPPDHGVRVVLTLRNPP